MERIAFIMGESFFYWSHIVLTLAVVTGSCVFLALYLGRGGRASGALLAVPLAVVLSLVLARFVHWYCRTDSYESLRAAMTQFSAGGFALLGAFAGCALTAVILRLVRLSRNLPEMLDCMSVAGSLAIALGRLASFFNASDRGQIIEGMTKLPWVYPVTNAVSGVTEYRLATFAIQAMVAGLIFAVLLIFYICGSCKKTLRDGDTTLLFLLFYGVSQVVLDSTRYDSLFFRSNGFVSMVQVLGALGMGLAIVIFSVRLVKARGFRLWYVGAWLAITALIGGAGYMEYHVQRHGNQAAFAYSVMSVCLICVAVLTVVIRRLGIRKKQTAAAYPIDMN